MELLNVSIGGQQRLNIIKFLAQCQNTDGGFGGGPYQVSHLAPTYATVNALVILGGNEAYKIINRETLGTIHILRKRFYSTKLNLTYKKISSKCNVQKEILLF